MNILNCTSVIHSQQQNLNSKIEKATPSSSFLDVEIKSLENGVQSLVQHKPSHMRLLLNYNAVYFAFVTRHLLTSQYSSSGVIES